MREITSTEFKENIYDIENHTFKNQKPTIIMFSAEWCGPCKMLTPVMDELGEKYSDDVNVVKVNVDAEHEIASMFNVRSIPTTLFLGNDHSPEVVIGNVMRDQLEEKFKGIIGGVAA